MGVKWLQEGDANTAFFHSLVRHQRNSNYISRIKKDDGVWYESLQDIKSSSIAFYSEHFSSNRQRMPMSAFPFDVPIIAARENEMMRELPTLEEIKAVVFAMDIESASGLDGFGAGFHQHC